MFGLRHRWSKLAPTLTALGLALPMGLGLVLGLTACAVEKVKFIARPDIIVSATKLAVLEGGETTFTVELSAPPGREATITLTSSAEEKLQGAPLVLRFTEADWDLPQSVTLTGMTDRDALNEETSVRLEAAGLSPVVVDVTIVECPTLAAQDFWVMFNPNYDGGGRRDIHVAGPAGTEVTIADMAPATIPANGILTVDIGLTRTPVPDVVETGKAFQVSATEPVQVFGNNFQNFTVDAFTAVPVQLLGTDYRAIGYSTSSQAQISVYATEDNTTVTIGAAEPFVLNRGQSFLRTGGGDVTGTRIVSDKPIGVNTGDNCLFTGAGACDHVEEMLFPVGSWSSDYFIPIIPQDQSFRVVAATDDTKVTVDGIEVATLAAGAFYSGEGGGKRVQTSQPSQAYVIALGESASTGDPAFILLPGAQNAVDSTTFSALAADNINTLVISMPTAAIATLLLDGAPIDATVTWTAYAGGDFSYAQVVIEAGSHTLTADQAFIPVIWGEKPFESYGYVAGYGYPKATCQLP